MRALSLATERSLCASHVWQAPHSPVVSLMNTSSEFHVAQLISALGPVYYFSKPEMILKDAPPAPGCPLSRQQSARLPLVT